MSDFHLRDPCTGLRFHSSLLGQATPSLISIETTNFCNLKCSHCIHSHFPNFRKGHAEVDLFEKLVPYLGSNGASVLTLNESGEPFVSRHWRQFLRLALRIEGLQIAFITNGLLIGQCLDELTHPNVSLGVSLDGASETTYAHFRGSGHFQDVIRNLERLHARSLADRIPTPARTLITTLSQVNVQEMADIVRIAHRIGFSGVCFQFQTFYDEHAFRNQSLFFNRDLYDKHAHEAWDLAKTSGIRMQFPDTFATASQIPREPLPFFWLYRDEENRLRVIGQPPWRRILR